MPQIDKILVRGGTALEWTTANPVLDERELGFETDTRLHKWGNGVTAWNDLPYALGGGNFIPLTGTDAGIPVTGDIDVNDQIFIGHSDGDFTFYVGFNYTENKGIVVNDDYSGKGLVGVSDFSANYANIDNAFIQNGYFKRERNKIQNEAPNNPKIDNYTWESINGNAVLKGNGGTNGSTTPAIAVSDTDLSISFENQSIAKVYSDKKKAVTYEALQDYVANNAGSSNFIPLTGTEFENGLSGTVVFEGQGIPVISNNGSKIWADNGWDRYTALEYYDGTNGSGINVKDYNIIIGALNAFNGYSGNAENFQGLIGLADYSINYAADDNAYGQVGFINGYVETASITGTKNIDWDRRETVGNYTLTGATTLTESNLRPRVLEFLITGDFALTLPSTWTPYPNNDAYDGTIDNHIVVTCIVSTSGSEKIFYTLTNIA